MSKRRTIGGSRRAIIGAALPDSSVPRPGPVVLSPAPGGGNGNGLVPGNGNGGGVYCREVMVEGPNGAFQKVQICNWNDVCGTVVQHDGQRCYVHQPPGGDACPVPIPKWWDPAMATVCTPGNIPQCNFAFGTCIDLDPGDPAALLSFDPEVMNAELLKPIGLMFTGLDKDDPSTNRTRAFEALSIERNGIDYLGGAPLNLDFYNVESDNALTLFNYPEMRDGSSPLDVLIDNVATLGANRICAVLFGFALR